MTCYYLRCTFNDNLWTVTHVVHCVTVDEQLPMWYTVWQLMNNCPCDTLCDSWKTVYPCGTVCDCVTFESVTVCFIYLSIWLVFCLLLKLFSYAKVSSIKRIVSTVWHVMKVHIWYTVWQVMKCTHVMKVDMWYAVWNVMKSTHLVRCVTRDDK